MRQHCGSRSRLLDGVARFLFAFGMVATGAAPAHANFLYASYSVLNDQNVVVDFNSGPKTGSESGGSGRITLNGLTDNGISEGPLTTWCVDIYDDLASRGSFTALTSYASTDPLYGKIDAVIANRTPLLGGNTYASAAVQIAIWELEYGSAVTIHAGAAVETLAATFVANVTSGTWQADPGTEVWVLSESGNQSQAYLGNVAEPSGLAVLGIGLLGLGAVAIRRSLV